MMNPSTVGTPTVELACFSRSASRRPPLGTDCSFNNGAACSVVPTQTALPFSRRPTDRPLALLSFLSLFPRTWRQIK
ncbi:hypothetical protein [Pandoravirus japonicus]|uniref:Uncharacterized protein n=1 Tax=Pandoravirus japonicus TaxID=2823154 RepID=A0A811BNU8_9VIRU|nr:hypothetical protein [Pandoravirus japonicus]